jgi:hypothetical protein
VKKYRLVESAPVNGKRDGKTARTTIYSGPDKEALKQAISAWVASDRKPWAEIAYYHGATRIFAYEL